YLLLAEGHRKIAFIVDSRTRLAYTRRRMVYDAGLDSAGIPPDTRIVLEGDAHEGGRKRVKHEKLFDRMPPAFDRAVT
ncbi:LacI family transcriptional regulator, partial [Rhizobium ruizarguesonis]